jgi:hypothetical protein
MSILPTASKAHVARGARLFGLALKHPSPLIHPGVLSLPQSAEAKVTKPAFPQMIERQLAISSFARSMRGKPRSPHAARRSIAGNRFLSTAAAIR